MPTFIQKSRQASPLQKATGHQVTGVGRRKVKRQFFGLTPKDEAEITKRVLDFIARSLRK